MPELPEVEIVKRGLENKILGREFDDIEVRANKLFQGKVSDVKGPRVKAIFRHAKMIEVDLSNGKALLIHLKMTGQLVFDEKAGDKSKRMAGGHPSDDWVADLPNKFTHIIFKFRDGSILYFNDLRKFGYVKVYDQAKLFEAKELKDLGPDPFTKELNEEYLMRKIAKRPKIKIKQVIMDQTVISGVGNIYADESLFCAGISPLRLAKDVKKSELTKLIECIRKMLKKGLEYGGSSENTYVNIEGKKGEMQNYFQIYRKTGKTCPRGCGIVKRVVVGGRGTHYCPVCQR
jgi:formamidopyrimidine-DNA glycosylase